MKVFATVGLAAALFAAQVPENQRSGGFLNGRYWQAMNDDARTFFVLGYIERSKEADDRSDIPTATIGEDVAGVTKVYEAAENASLPIQVALKVFAMKVAGEPAAVIENYLRACRKIAAEGRNPAKTKK